MKIIQSIINYVDLLYHKRKGYYRYRLLCKDRETGEWYYRCCIAKSLRQVLRKLRTGNNIYIKVMYLAKTPINIKEVINDSQKFI